MANLYVRNGKLLVQRGGLLTTASAAAIEECCCGGGGCSCPMVATTVTLDPETYEFSGPSYGVTVAGLGSWALPLSPYAPNEWALNDWSSGVNLYLHISTAECSTPTKQYYPPRLEVELQQQSGGYIYLYYVPCCESLTDCPDGYSCQTGEFTWQYNRLSPMRFDAATATATGYCEHWRDKDGNELSYTSMDSEGTVTELDPADVTIT